MHELLFLRRKPVNIRIALELLSEFVICAVLRLYFLTTKNRMGMDSASA